MRVYTRELKHQTAVALVLARERSEVDMDQTDAPPLMAIRSHARRRICWLRQKFGRSDTSGCGNSRHFYLRLRGLSVGLTEFLQCPVILFVVLRNIPRLWLCFHSISPVELPLEGVLMLPRYGTYGSGVKMVYARHFQQ